MRDIEHSFNAWNSHWCLKKTRHQTIWDPLKMENCQAGLPHLKTHQGSSMRILPVNWNSGHTLIMKFQIAYLRANFTYKVQLEVYKITHFLIMLYYFNKLLSCNVYYIIHSVISCSIYTLLFCYRHIISCMVVWNDIMQVTKWQLSSIYYSSTRTSGAKAAWLCWKFSNNNTQSN